MMSAGSTGSETTSAHPALRRSSLRILGTPTMTAPANTTTVRTRAHRDHRTIILLIPPPQLHQGRLTQISGRVSGAARSGVVGSALALTNRLSDGSVCERSPQVRGYAPSRPDHEAR